MGSPALPTMTTTAHMCLGQVDAKYVPSWAGCPANHWPFPHQPREYEGWGVRVHAANCCEGATPVNASAKNSHGGGRPSRFWVANLPNRVLCSLHRKRGIKGWGSGPGWMPSTHMMSPHLFSRPMLMHSTLSSSDATRPSRLVSEARLSAYPSTTNVDPRPVLAISSMNTATIWSLQGVLQPKLCGVGGAMQGCLPQVWGPTGPTYLTSPRR